MTRKTLLTAALVLASMAAGAEAQSLQMVLRPDSKLTLDGSSNIHEWACKSSAFVATVDVDTGFITGAFAKLLNPIGSVAVQIPVKTLKCGHGKMDDNMYKALKAEEFPEIRYALKSYTVDREHATADAFTAKTIGDLTVSGQTIRVEIPITVERSATGSVRGQGTVNLLMTDFGIKPPTALLGTLRTKNEIKIGFDVLLDKGTVVALGMDQ